MNYTLKRGFGKDRLKEYFVVQADGDTLGGIVCGPFENEEQAATALDACRPLFFRHLCVIGGHLAPDWQSLRNRP